jgi:hypothetical protein
MPAKRPTRMGGADERDVAIRKAVRISWTCPDSSADHGRPPSAPPVLGLVTPPALLVAADYPPSTWSFG